MSVEPFAFYLLIVLCISQWRIQGGSPPPPPTDQNFLNFMQFFGNFSKNYMLAPPRLRVSSGNPGSTPVSSLIGVSAIYLFGLRTIFWPLVLEDGGEIYAHTSVADPGIPRSVSQTPEGSAPADYFFKCYAENLNMKNERIWT